MTSERPPARDARPALGRRIAAVLRAGTLLAVAAVGAGFVLSLVAGGRGPGSRPVFELIGTGGADALTGAGLLGLTLLPIAVLGVAAATFLGAGERSRLTGSVVALGLLLAGLATAVVIGTA